MNCRNHQVPLKERDFSQFVLENGTKLEIQNEKRKICRFGLGQPLQRQFRTNHTQDPIEHGQVSIKKIAKEMNFLAKITSINPEIQSSRYHQTKGRQNIDGVDSKLLSILRTFLKLSTVFSKNFISHTLSP